MKPIVIIPARGGSKRISRKNISTILGKPALGILLENLIEFNIFEEIIVSTDDEEITQVAERFGARVIQRSRSELSNDLTNSEEVIRDGIKSLNLESSKIPIFCIYPLAILVKKHYLLQALGLLELNPGQFVIACGEINPNPTRHTFTRDKDTIRVIFPENNTKRSQELDVVYADAGMFYLANPATWINKNQYWYNNNTSVVVVNKNHFLDVDTLEDLEDLRSILHKNYIHNQESIINREGSHD